MIKLAIVVPRFNPCGYERPRANFREFITSLWNQVDPDDVFAIEAVFPGEDRDCGWWTRRELNADARHVLWQKEPMINRAIKSLPAKYDAAAWIDADLIFDCPWWCEKACETLAEFPVVQLFERINYDQCPGDYSWDPSTRGCGTVAAVPDRLGFRAPGGAIACRRELLDRADGIYDRHVLGGGDEIFMDACMGRAERMCRKLNPLFASHVHNWCERFGQHKTGFIQGSVRHLWHGDRAGRQYKSRHDVLASHNFDPETDVRVGENGLLEWSSDKPALHAAVRDYFRGRAEDQITASVS